MLFIKKNDDAVLLIQKYVNDIIFGSTIELLFASIMKSKFETSTIGEFNFFFELQVNQMKEGTFIFQEKYAIALVKKFGMEARNLIHQWGPINQT